MGSQPLFPDAIAEVSDWFSAQGDRVSTRKVGDEVGDRCRVWQLDRSVAELEGSPVSVVLSADFPASAARLEVSRTLCLRYPHIEDDGHFCHGVEPEPQDFNAPIEAVGRVLARLQEYLTLSKEPGWVEAEFHRERQDYWSRHVTLARGSNARRRPNLLLDAFVAAGPPQACEAILLEQGGRALATSAPVAPEKVASLRGWQVGTLVRGGCLVARLPDAERWTPSTWPKAFTQLDSLLSSISGSEEKLATWYRSRRWPNKAPVMVALLQGPAAYGWQILPAIPLGRAQPTLVPIKVTRVDRQWSLSRDHRTERLHHLSTKQVVVLGCGSLGSQVVELLARAGVGRIHVVDPQVFEPENVSRHVLGLQSIGGGKAGLVCTRTARNVPGCELSPFKGSAAQWIAGDRSRGALDLVVDCTGERCVRLLLSKLRRSALAGAPILTTWMEPECSAAHAVVVAGDDVWPSSDPVETAVNVAQWPAATQVNLPGCGTGFHPYGMADSARAAGLAAERALAVLSASCTTSGIWSLVRNRQYFQTVSPGIEFNIEPPVGPDQGSVTLVRSLPTAHR